MPTTVDTGLENYFPELSEKQVVNKLSIVIINNGSALSY